LTLFLLIAGLASADVQGPLTSNFQRWLSMSRYRSYLSQFVRSDLGNYGSYGGRTSITQTVSTKQPVVFIHGAGDQALDNPSSNTDATGWTNSISYFLSQGYDTSHVYALTWGAGAGSNVDDQAHTCSNLLVVRSFLQSVYEYNVIPWIDVVAYDMGVTLARKAIMGGSHTDPDGTTCSLGAPISGFIKTFLGIGGANLGLSTCQSSSTAYCSDVNGLHPGNCNVTYCPGLPENASDFLKDIWMKSHPTDTMGTVTTTTTDEGLFTYSFWSYGDDVIGSNDLVWGEPTSRIPKQTGEWVSETMTHLQLKDETAERQYSTVNKQSPADCPFSYCN